MPVSPVRQLTVSIADAATMLGISPSHCYSMVHAGQLPALRLGHRLLIRRADLRRLLAGTDEAVAQISATGNARQQAET